MRRWPRRDLCNTWEVGNLQRYLAHLPEVAPFSRLSITAFLCLYGPVRAPPVQPHFSTAVDVAPRVCAKVAVDQVWQHYHKSLRELSRDMDGRPLSYAWGFAPYQPGKRANPREGLGYYFHPDLPHEVVVQQGQGAPLLGSSVVPARSVANVLHAAHVQNHVLNNVALEAAQLQVIPHHAVDRVLGHWVRGTEGVLGIVQDRPRLTFGHPAAPGVVV